MTKPSDNELQKKKILFTASTMSHLENFHRPYLDEFKRLGWEVEAIELPVSKSFFSPKNLNAVFYTRRLIKAGRFDVISSHSTLAGIVTRLAVMLSGKERKRLKVFHTAHGYLFHDDHSLKKWTYLLPEILCGRVTNVLMVMNHEDLAIAEKYKLCGKSNKIYYINGMGIDLSKFHPRYSAPEIMTEKRKAFGFEPDDFIFVYAAEFSKRKNHELLLRGFAKAVEQMKDESKATPKSESDIEAIEPEAFSYAHSATKLKLALAGDGALFAEMKTLAATLGIETQVIFLGYRRNMHELYPCCDVAVSTSKIEGLPFNIMEAMACGLPVIASNIKGHQELVTHGENGLLFESGDVDGLARGLTDIVLLDATARALYGTSAKEKVKVFSLETVFPEVMGIYKVNF